MLNAPLLVGLRVLLFLGYTQVAGGAILVDENDPLLPLLVGRDPPAFLQKHTCGVDVLPDYEEILTGGAHFTSSCPAAERAVWSLPKKVFAQALVPRRALS